tara:strand:+ start:7392 stop:8501 length:1110 start_codon:yes stop_codon:yes gene_type:complete
MLKKNTNELSDNLTNKIICGNCIEVMEGYPDNCIDLIFADPPYNLQLNETLYRPDYSKVDAVTEDWDKFRDFQSYDKFTQDWLSECKRVLKPNGSIWVIGSYHNIFRIGYIMQNLGFWILNDVIWSKTNPMPNFRGRRFTNAHETVIWSAKDKYSRYKYNYDALKSLNDDTQMRSDWHIPICNGKERLRDDTGNKIHPTQKPEALLHRIIISATDPQSIIMDPFLGSGTSAAVAKKLGRRWIGIEKDEKYIKVARDRLNKVSPADPLAINIKSTKRDQKRIPFGSLVERGLIKTGEILYCSKKKNKAIVKADGSLELRSIVGSIHKLGAYCQGTESCNGWTYWHYVRNNTLFPIDQIREELKSNKGVIY